MHPILLDRLMVELQREREKELLNFTSEERLVHNAKLISSLPSLKYLNIERLRSLWILSKRIIGNKYLGSTAFYPESNNCASCRPLQKQAR